VARRTRLRWLFRLRSLGFTLIEMLVIVAVVGVLGLMSAPSLIATMDSVKIDQNIAEIRTALQDTQRQAIRRSRICSVTMDIDTPTPNSTESNRGHGSTNISINSDIGSISISSSSSGSSSSGSSSSSSSSSSGSGTNTLAGNCLTTGNPDLPTGVDMATNLLGTSSADVEVKFGVLGSAAFNVVNSSTTVQDPSGKIVTFISSKNNAQKKCIAISNTLGLTRVGQYSGGINPADITASGVCTALEWNKQ
jgi:Tfp pilus assembly protein FimT